MYFPESDSPFYRVTYLSNYSPKMTPPGEHFSLLAEVSSSPYKRENPNDVVDRTIKGMISSRLLTPEQAASKIVSRQLLRVPYSYPVPTIGRDRALAAIHPWLMERDIYSRGRFGAWKYEVANTDHSVMQGVELVDRLVLVDRSVRTSDNGTSYTFRWNQLAQGSRAELPVSVSVSVMSGSREVFWYLGQRDQLQIDTRPAVERAQAVDTARAWLRPRDQRWELSQPDSVRLQVLYDDDDRQQLVWSVVFRARQDGPRSSIRLLIDAQNGRLIQGV